MAKEWVTIDKQAPCWKHFLKNKSDGKEVKCNVCSKILKSPTCDTALYHLNNVHYLKVNTAAEQKTLEKENTQQGPRQPSIVAALTQKDTLPKGQFQLEADSFCINN